ncbi:MAG: hypothetical protein LBE10_10990 [Treponema sp.]|nr:hypothetical protein [Treponema sp.]
MVNKSALKTSISAAEAALAEVTVSADGTDVATSKKWVKQADKDTFSTAITAAKTVDANAAATQDEVYAARLALDTAARVFTAAQKNGTNVRAALAEAISAAQAVHDATTASADGSAVSNASTWVSSTDKADFAAVITAATAVKDNDSATSEQLTDALTALSIASSAFTAAQKPGYLPVSGGRLKISPIYRGFQVELIDLSGLTPNYWHWILCDGAPVVSIGGVTDTAAIKYIFQGSKFDGGSHIFQLQDTYGVSQGTPLTAYAVDVTGGTGTDAADLYHTNIDAVNFAFNGPAWQLTRNAAPVKNDVLLPDSGLQTTNSWIQFYQYNSEEAYSGSSGWDEETTWTAINVWRYLLYIGEIAFSDHVEYTYNNGEKYRVYAGNVEHQSYPEVPVIQASGTSTLTIITDSSWVKIGLFKDAACTQPIDSDGWISNYGSWLVYALRSDPDLAPGKTVYYGVILDGNSGPKIIPISGKSLTIEAGKYDYQNIDLGTVTGSYP